jgi:hypothetical protein
MKDSFFTIKQLFRNNKEAEQQDISGEDRDGKLLPPL